MSRKHEPVSLLGLLAADVCCDLMMAELQRGEAPDGKGGVLAAAEPAKEPGSPAGAGGAVHIPLLQRCKARIACQAARMPQTELPQIKLQLGVSPAPGLANVSMQSNSTNWGVS